MGIKRYLKGVDGRKEGRRLFAAKLAVLIVLEDRTFSLSFSGLRYCLIFPTKLDFSRPNPPPLGDQSTGSRNESGKFFGQILNKAAGIFGSDRESPFLEVALCPPVIVPVSE